MATVNEKWLSRQKVDAATMNRAAYQPIRTLSDPPYFRATGIGNTAAIQKETSISWMESDTAGGFRTSNMTDFKPPVPGIYWVTATIAMTTPSTMDGTQSTAALILQVGTTSKAGSPAILKGFTTTKVKGSYQSVHVAGLMFIANDQTIWASAEGIGGAWTKPKSGNPATSLASFSAVLISADATSL
ncbi:hypothetical protein [Streptomyces sp. NPDC059994]|uniref:hypothetical protein n=1 Tax=Streptomyces sp. NPDC059994 TaxID=3347029 RepID=UPI0036BD1375